MAMPIDREGTKRYEKLPPLPLPLIVTYNFEQLWCCWFFFLTIAVSIELLCGHCTDVCSLIRCDFFPPP